ncbi:PTS fructose transporter subunit IID [Clostridium sp. chh4-2]|uniref:PTS system mannose/fructose/sorbose family transporter subunit IID n=1 Tax=Clostridium sp. chh4-2 TaxID=2067550 RepID=UPI000CCFC519|nr:PTS system mannose/fructose/sorbose family transporter subunit IID [Clostridium sp. chh4-2]PNV63632.1 PTS fructose transporter subunit IID [Clostridium sp. chh4-2]
MSKNNEMSGVKKQTFWRWYFLGGAGWNYEKMQGLGYYFSMLPLVKKCYQNEEDKKTAAMTELQFFNTNNTMAPIIMGVDNAIQEEKGIDAIDTVASLKTGMMGPLAGIGDTLFHVIPSTIIGSIASYMALEGSPAALILWILFGILRLGFMRSFFAMGYREGAKVVSELGNRLKKITKAANVLGIMVIGALVPSVVNAKFAYVFNMGEVTKSVQELADQIMPALAPALVVFFTYWMLGRKKMNSTRVTFLLVFVGIIAYNLKIFG